MDGAVGRLLARGRSTDCRADGVELAGLGAAGRKPAQARCRLGAPPGPEGQAHWTDPVGAPALPSCLSNFPAISWGPGGSRGLRCPVLPILGAPDPLGSLGEGPFGTAPGSVRRLARG